MSQRMRARARAAAAGLTAGCATADIPARYHTLSNTRATLLIHDWLRCCSLPLLVLPHRCCHTAPAAWARLGCYYADDVTLHVRRLPHSLCPFFSSQRPYPIAEKIAEIKLR